MNRKIDDLIGKRPEKKNISLALALVFLIILTISSLILLSTFIGYVYQNYFSGQAGFVYNLVLEYRECAYLWSGVFGVSVMVPSYTNQQDLIVSSCGMYDTNLLFNCLPPGATHVVMASLVPSSSINWNSLQPATALDVDNYLGIDTSVLMSAQKTFLETAKYQIGGTVYTVPATMTKKQDLTDNSTNFDMGLLKDGNNNLIYITHVLTNFTNGFNGRYYNYQMILPVKNGTNPDYYFFTDPSYVCPAGEGVLPAPGVVAGNTSTNTGERLIGVIVVVGGKTAISGVEGYYNVTVPEGTYNLFGIKTGYQTFVSNVTVYSGNTTYLNIVMVPEAIPNPNTGPGVGPGVSNGVGPGQDVGPGEAPRVPVVEQPKRIEGIDYIISISKIDRKLIVGNFLQEIVSFYSYKKSIANLQFSIEGENLSDMIKLDKSTMALAPNTNDQLTLTIFGEGVPGIYNGSLVISGDLQEKIPIQIELLSKDRLPIESLLLMLDINNKEIYASDKLKFKTDLHNLLTDQSYPVSLQFTIQNAKGETIWSDTSNVYIQTSFSLLKSVTLPDNLPTGDYILRVTADYLGLSSGASASFSVVLPFYDRIFFGMKIWLWIAILLGLAILLLAYYLTKKYIESKKRYAFKLDYNELPKPGPKSAFVGKIAETEHKTYFDLEQFKVHTIVAGATGGGKSVAAQVIVEEALVKNIAVIIFDPTAQWSGMLRKCTDKNMLKLYPAYGMKPQDSRAFNGNVRMITNPLEIIDIKKYMKPGEIQIFAMNKMDPKDIDIFVANTIREVFHANFNETPEIRLLLVYDEVHRLLPKFGGSGEGFLQIERGCREFRKWGIGILMISQVLADFVGQIKANINTEIQMRTRDEGDLTRIKEKYGPEVLQGLVKASVGSGMVENPAYNRGKPYFVSFRPLVHNTQRLADEELEKYNKFNELIDDLSYQLEQLEAEKQDVFDLKLQLKLALDKVKGGNFNMVDIYLQEVIPRLEKMWIKLGKKPKKREIKTVDLKSLKEDLKKAEDSRKEFEKQNAAQVRVQAVEKKKVLKYEKLVPLNKALNFSNGITVTSLQELGDVMPNITGPTFKHHVTKDKNDIADWVRDAIKDNELSEKLRQAKTNDDYVKILSDDKAKNNKMIDAEDAVSPVPAAIAQETSAAQPPITQQPEKSASTAQISPDNSPPPSIPQIPIAPTGMPTDVMQESLLWKDLKDKLEWLDIDKKIELLTKSEQKYPSDMNVKFSLAILYHKKKDYEQAEKRYKEILQIYPSNTKALYYLGGLLKNEKKYDEALNYFNNYMAVKKDDQKVKELIAKIWSRK